MSDIQLAPPDNEPQPKGRENMARMIDYTSDTGREHQRREQRRQLTEQQIQTLLRRHYANPRRLGL